MNERTLFSATSFTLTATASDNYTGISKYDFYINGEAKTRHTEETTAGMASYTMTGVSTGNTNCYVIVTDSLGNETKKPVTGETKLYTWEKWTRNAKTTYIKDTNVTSKDYNNYIPPSVSWYDAYTFDLISGFKPVGESHYSGSGRT